MSQVIDATRPYKVRTGCGHVVIRKMRESTAGVPWTEETIIEAPFGRPCDGCERIKKLLPFRISSFEVNAKGNARAVMGGDDFMVAYVDGRSAEENNAIAEYIVEACNKREDYLEERMLIDAICAGLKDLSLEHIRLNGSHRETLQPYTDVIGMANNLRDRLNRRARQ